MTIYGELMTRVDDGESFHIDFEKRNMKVGKQFLIKDGKYDVKRKLIGGTPTDVMSIIEELYQSYKYSLPSERSCNKRRQYFKALRVDELTDKQLMTGCIREGARARLEGFILCMVLNGSLKWDESWGTFFWQSEKDDDLVILRRWVENNNN